MYGDFVFETRGISSVETEKGFATFILKDKECYIEDLYVKPEFRRKGAARELADKVKDNAQRVGCVWLTTTVNCVFHDPSTSVEVILAYGFKIISAQNNAIFFKMEI